MTTNNTKGMKMKLEILEKKSDVGVIKLNLVDEGDGICVVGIDRNGHEWYLLSLQNVGTVKMFGCLSNELGFKLDDMGRIKVENR